MEAPEGCPPEVFRVMNETWALQAQDRPSFGQVKLLKIGRKYSLTRKEGSCLVSVELVFLDISS